MIKKKPFREHMERNRETINTNYVNKPLNHETRRDNTTRAENQKRSTLLNMKATPHV